MSVALPFGLTPDVLEAAMAEEDPESLAAATRLRATFDPALAAAALTQAGLRRQARAKFGAEAETMYFTRDGLEQATRPAIADHHARRFVAAGVRRVIDLGCGIGSDALAFARAGLEVVAVERDPDTAAVAAANLAGRATVVCADAEQVAGDLLADGSAVYADPARRTERGRVWRLAEVTPPWSFVTRLLDGRRPAGVKLAPALSHAELPATAEAEWLSHGGAVVETGLWAGPGAAPGVRAAVVWPADGSPAQRVAATAEAPLPVRDLGDYLYEPDGAVIRSGAIADVGLLLGAGLLDPHVAYLTADRLQTTPFATAYAVHDQLPYRRKVLHRWLVEHGIGRLEIKRRGLDFDPAVLRRELRPAGPSQATMIISRTPRGAVVAVVERVDNSSNS